MAKITGPLMSLDASGSVASTITFSKWKGRNYVRQLVKPSNPKTPAQTAFRAMFGFLASTWKNLGPSNQGSWDSLAATTNVSPFNAYTKQNQNRWTQTLTPQQMNAQGGVNTPGTIGSPTATGGVRQIQLDIPITVAASNWGIIIYRSPNAGFTPTQNDVIAVIVADAVATWTYIDSGLTPGTWYYRFATFTDDGVQLLDATQVSAVAS